MSRAIKHQEAMIAELELSVPEKAIGLLPIVAPIVGAILLIVVRIQAGRAVGFIYCGCIGVTICGSTAHQTCLYLKELMVHQIVSQR